LQKGKELMIISVLIHEKEIIVTFVGGSGIT